MGLLRAMIQESVEGCRAGFDRQCGCDLPGDAEILDALAAVQPAESNKVTRTLGVPWRHRGTIARRLNELRRSGRVTRYNGAYRVLA